MDFRQSKLNEDDMKLGRAAEVPATNLFELMKPHNL